MHVEDKNLKRDLIEARLYNLKSRLTQLRIATNSAVAIIRPMKIFFWHHWLADCFIAVINIEWSLPILSSDMKASRLTAVEFFIPFFLKKIRQYNPIKFNFKIENLKHNYSQESIQFTIIMVTAITAAIYRLKMYCHKFLMILWFIKRKWIANKWKYFLFCL